mmetsp:Transcript_22350/g.35908  ORF Transcript_22350/g.35908 Transcript_22350/m.35908 type:complete len:161 (-) Transcript_22350:344-826(-)|eukprot:jgi/Bigna1/89425/estExt_fgenesh1_pg.C_490043
MHRALLSCSRRIASRKLIISPTVAFGRPVAVSSLGVDGRQQGCFRAFCDRSVVEASLDLEKRAKEWRSTMRKVRKEDPGDIDGIIEAKVKEVREMLQSGTPPSMVEAQLEEFEASMKASPKMSMFGASMWIFMGGLTVYSVLMLKGMVEEKKDQRAKRKS